MKVRVLFLLASSFVPLSAHADSSDSKAKRLAILPSVLGGEGMNIPAADQLFDASAKGARLRPDLEIVPYNDLFIAGTDALAAMVRDCGADVRCVSKALTQAKVDLGLRIIVNFALDPPLLISNLVDPWTEKVSNESILELDKNASLGDMLERAANSVLDSAGYARGARIKVAVKPEDAKLELPLGARREGDSFVVPPGRHDFRATREGFDPESVAVVALAGEEREVKLVLQPHAGSSGIGWGWWLAGGSALLLGASAVVFAVTSPFSTHPSHDCLCITTPASPCTHCH